MKLTSSACSARPLGPRAYLAALAAILAICVCGALAACNLGPEASGAAPTATSAPRPTPTATIPPPGPPAVLGAPGARFTDKYGPPTNQSPPGLGELHLLQYPNLPTDYLVVQEGKVLNLTPGANDAASIAVTAPPGQPWPLSVAKQTCAGFAPTDAQLLQHVSRTTAQGATPTGWDDIYQSNQLANIFPAAAFVDANQYYVAAGTFDISYVYASSGDTAHITTCTLALGSQQTLD